MVRGACVLLSVVRRLCTVRSCCAVYLIARSVLVLLSVFRPAHSGCVILLVASRLCTARSRCSMFLIVHSTFVLLCGSSSAFVMLGVFNCALCVRAVLGSLSIVQGVCLLLPQHTPLHHGCDIRGRAPRGLFNVRCCWCCCSASCSRDAPHECWAHMSHPCCGSCCCRGALYHRAELWHCFAWLDFMMELPPCWLVDWRQGRPWLACVFVLHDCRLQL
jgi:hypothetical protein